VTDCATKKQWLLEAELALHKVSTGTAEVTVQFGSGKSVTYNQANIEQLRTYVQDLRTQVAECDPSSGETSQRRRPIRFTF
jgi:hypothetical protein